MRKLLDIYDTYCLKGIAMLMIIISHTFNGYPIESNDVYYPLWMNWLHIDLWGGMGVAVFLLLSGYGLFTTLNKRQSIDKKYGQWWWNNILCFPLGALMAYKYDFFSSLSSRLVCLVTGILLLAVFCIHMNTVVFHLLFSVFCIYAVRLDRYFRRVVSLYHYKK